MSLETLGAYLFTAMYRTTRKFSRDPKVSLHHGRVPVARRVYAVRFRACYRKGEIRVLDASG